MSHSNPEIMASPDALFDLSGYHVLGKPKIRDIDGKSYMIQQYDSPHENEFCVMECKDGKICGKCQLFEYPLFLQLLL